MIKRTIEISQQPAHLAVKLDQLLIRRDGKTVGSIPCEDIGAVLVDHPGTTYSHAALAALADCGAAVVVCGRDHLPAAILLPIADHNQVVWRLNEQLAVRPPLRKQLWKQLVQAKIRGQAGNLVPGSAARSKLLALARNVRSGDPANIEAQAAKVYWDNWLDGEWHDGPRREGSENSGRHAVSQESPRACYAIEFRRDFDAPGLNSLLNYGYAVMRAAVARAIVAAGLHPAIGLHHHSRGNAFCLADDLVEPLRPIVDERARELFRAGSEELDQPTKAGLLELLTLPVELGGQTGPLMVSLHRMTASLVRCFQGQEKTLEIPTPANQTLLSAADAATVEETEEDQDEELVQDGIEAA